MNPIIGRGRFAARFLLSDALHLCRVPRVPAPRFLAATAKESVDVVQSQAHAPLAGTIFVF